MDARVEKGGEGVASERAKEDKGDDGVVDVVIVFEIGDKGAVCAVVHPENDEGEETGEDPEGVLPRVVPGLLLG